MKTIICVFAALCLINISIASNAIISSQSCDQLPPMPNFRLERQMGLWYVHQTRVINEFDNVGCWTEHFNSTGNTIQEDDSYRDLGNNANYTSSFFWTYSKPEFGFYSPIGLGTNTILKSDYINYSVEITCFDMGDHSERYVYVLTRRPTITLYIQWKIDRILADNGIDKTKLRNVIQDQKTCGPAPTASHGLGGLLQTLLSSLLSLLGL